MAKNPDSGYTLILVLGIPSNKIFNFFGSFVYCLNSFKILFGKLKDDVYLKCMFSRSKVKTDIVSWQDKNVDFNQYDALIIRSIWGFHHHLEEFVMVFLFVKMLGYRNTAF